MCGILSVIKKKNNELDARACRRALGCLTQRGPDLCTSQIWNQRVFLGQTILSITGDIKQSDAHLSSASGRYELLLNGEIYNYLDLNEAYLKGRMPGPDRELTDTQVLVYLHDCLDVKGIVSVLDGMFAYVILDKERNKLYLNRDPQGEKSLYVYEDAELVIISSELSPILDLVPSLRPDPQILRDYFHTRHFMFIERTLYRGVRQLRPGCLEVLDLESFRWQTIEKVLLEDWIDSARMQRLRQMSLDELADECDEILRSCIKQMVPNRKFASVFSGGVDSSLISHYVAEHKSPDILVAVNHVGKDQISCELEAFGKILKRDIERLDVDAFSYSREIIRCQRICRSPLFSHSFVGQSIQSAFVRRNGCKVLFGGDGADELFGGYACYSQRLDLNGKFSPSPYSAFLSSQVEFYGDDTSLLEGELELQWKRALEAYRHVDNDWERTVQAMMFIDLAMQLPAVGLRGSDLMSSMYAIETRSPFVRRPVVEFALNLPLKAKADSSEGCPELMRAKPLLKKLFLRYFPKELLVAKQGFSGFPNESAAYIGSVEDYLAIDFLGIDRKRTDFIQLERAAAWKIINCEYFLREAR